MANQNINKFVDSAMKGLPQKKIDEIVGQPITISVLELRTGENGDYFLAKCVMDEGEFSVPFGGVLKGQIDKAMAKKGFALPIDAMVKKRKSESTGRMYFTFEE